MKYLLDTNTCIEVIRSRNSGVLRQVQSHPPDELRVCSVVVSELYYGAFRSPDPATNLTLLRGFLSPFVSIPFDDAAAEATGRVRAALMQTGTPIGPYDLQIAGTALSKGLILVTHNTSEFSRVPGLVLEDWHT